MKVLIIGGTGRISTPITRRLLERGDDVTLYNRGKREASLPEGWKHIAGDRKEFSAFEKRMADAGAFDCVIDMVCYLPAEAQSAVRAFRKRVDQFIFCSTVDVYAKPAPRYPILEDNPRAGAYPYAANKIRCEDIFMAAHQAAQINTTIIRPAHTYSEQGQILFALGSSTVQLDRIRKAKPVVVHGDGSSLWVSCHAEDVARAFVNAAGNEKTYGRAYHVTGEEWLTWNHYHEAIAEAMGAPPPRLVHIPTEVLGRIAPGLARRTVENFSGNNIFDNTAAKADLGFKYSIPWKEGVGRAIAWLDEKGRIENSDGDTSEDRIIAAWEDMVGVLAARLAG